MDVSGVKRVVADRPVDSGQPVRRPGGSGNIGNHQYKNTLFCCYVLDAEETEEYMDEMSICDNSGCDTVTAFLLFPGKFVDMALRVG